MRRRMGMFRGKESGRRGLGVLFESGKVDFGGGGVALLVLRQTGHFIDAAGSSG
jgi:hypothetical protein